MYLGAGGVRGILNLVQGIVETACVDLRQDSLEIAITVQDETSLRIQFGSSGDLRRLYNAIATRALPFMDQTMFDAAWGLSSEYHVTCDGDCLTIEFRIDPVGHFSGFRFAYFGLLDQMRLLSLRYPGISVELCSDRVDGRQLNTISAPEGIRPEFDELLATKHKPFPVIYFDGLVGGQHLQLCAAWRGDWFPDPEGRFLTSEVRSYNLSGAAMVGITTALRAACRNYVKAHQHHKWMFRQPELQHGLVVMTALGRAVPEPETDELAAKDICKLLKPLIAAAFEAAPETTDRFISRFSREAFSDSILRKFQ